MQILWSWQTYLNLSVVICTQHLYQIFVFFQLDTVHFNILTVTNEKKNMPKKYRIAATGI